MTPAETCAAAIAPLVGNELAITFVAIAGCESSFGTNNYTNHGYTGSGTCQGARSFGAWQINMQAHGRYLQQVTGSTNPCTWAHWLMDVHNNAVAAKHVFDSAGGSFTPWSTFNDGCYKGNLSAATQAVATVGQSTVPSPSTASPSTPIPFGPAGADWGPIILIGGAVMGVLVIEDAVKATKDV